MMLNVATILVFLWTLVENRPLQVIQQSKISSYPKSIVNYLEFYGHLPLDKQHSQKEIYEAMRLFQVQFKIPVTGLFDDKTRRLMEMSRCGEVDMPAQKQVKQMNKHKKEYTFFIQNWSPLLPRRRQILAIRNGFYYWRHETHTYLHLHWDNTNPDFIVSFVPAIPGNSTLHYKMVSKISKARNKTRVYLNVNAIKHIPLLYQISRHVFGHLFNKQHEIARVIMSPFILDENNRTNGFSANEPPSDYQNCNATIRSIHLQPNEGKYYIFTGDDRQWKIQINLTNGNNKCVNNIMPGYPNKFMSQWGDTIKYPSQIDEVFVLPHGKSKPWDSVFFVKDVFYRFASDNLNWTSSQPKKIKDWWHGVPDNIDAALYSKEPNYVLYFFKGKETFKFKLDVNETSFGYVMDKYPKPIGDEFPRVPENIDSAFHNYCDGKLVFFKGRDYWIFNNYKHQADGPYSIIRLFPDFCV